MLWVSRCGQLCVAASCAGCLIGLDRKRAEGRRAGHPGSGGSHTPCAPGPAGSEEGSEEERGSQEDSEADSEEEDEEVPRAVPLNGLGLRAGKARLRQLVDDEAEEGGSDSDQSLEPQQQRGARFAYEAGAAPAPHATFAPFGAPPHNHGLPGESGGGAAETTGP
jgi:hypothetical protein